MLRDFFDSRRGSVAVLVGSCFVVTLLWMPGLWYPLWADTAIYAALGDSLLHHGTFSLFGVPHVKYLPMYPLLTIPFTQMLGVRFGLKLLSLLSGFCVLILTHAVVRQSASRILAHLTVLFLVVQHSLPVMTSFGASDLPFTALILVCILFFLRAKQNPSFYLAFGVSLAVAVLMRWNAVPLFPVFLCAVLLRRRSDCFLWQCWCGFFLGLMPLLLWLLRLWMIDGSLMPEYASEQASATTSWTSALLRNAVFYLNPLHTIGVAFPFAIFGMYHYVRRYVFLFFCMVSLLALTSFWWSLGVRHAFPAFPILLFFAALGCRELVQRCGGHRVCLWIVSCSSLILFALQGLLICGYSVPACNAVIDSYAVFPTDLKLTQEGMYAWGKARTWINTHAESGAVIVLPDSAEAFAMSRGYFRDDLRVTAADDRFCPAYAIHQRSLDDAGSIVHTVPDLAPHTTVVRTACRAPAL